MNTIEERIRAAARAAAGTVPPDSVPPLELPAGRPSRIRRWQRDARSSGPAWARQLAPVAAALAVVAIVIAVLSVSRTESGPPSGTGTTGSAPGKVAAGPPLISYVASGQVPPHYVAITAHGNPNFNPSYAVVRATVSGKTLATIKPSIADGTIAAVTAATDDRTFVLDEQHWVTPQASANQGFEARAFYLFRLSPSGQPGPLTRLAMSVPGGEMMTGFALSPGGGKLAIALEPDNDKKHPSLQEIRLYTLATGAVRTWSGDGTIGSGADDARSLSWTADDQTLAFDWAGNDPGMQVGVRLLAVATEGGSLLAHSRLAVSLVNQPQPSATSVPARLSASTTTAGASSPRPSAVPTLTVPGVSPASQPAQPTCQEDSIITADASAIVCGAITATNVRVDTTGGGSPLKRDAETEFMEYSTTTGKITHTLGHWTFRSVGALAVDVLWSDPSGRVLIGVIPTAGAGQVGVIRGNEFTPIAAQAAAVASDSGTW